MLENLLLTNFLHSGSNPLIRRQAIDAVGKFDRHLKASEDWDYYLRLAASQSFVAVEDYQILYRQRSNNMSSNVETMKRTSYTVLERAYQKAPQHLQNLRPKSFSILHLYCAELYLRNSTAESGNISLVISELWRSIYLDPPTLLSFNTQRMALKALLRGFSLILKL